MTYLDFIFIAIILLGSAIAASKGLVKTVFGFASTLVSLVFAYIFYSNLAEFMIKSTNIFQFMQEKISKALDLETMARAVMNKQDSVDMIRNLQVPGFLQDLLLENNNTEIYRLLGIPSIDDITAYISGFLATIAINALSFMVLFFIGILIVGLLSYVMDIIARLPVLKQVNHVGGFLVGIVFSFFGLWIVSMILFFISNLQETTKLQLLIERSPFVMIFYENNLLLDILTDISKTLLP